MSFIKRTISVVLATITLLTLALSLSFTSNAVNPYSMSEKGLALTMSREGFRSTPYLDSGAYRIGYGTTYTSEIAAKYPDGITKEQAKALLISVLKTNYEPSLDKFLNNNGIKVTQYEYDALLDITYNIGPGMWTKYSTSDLVLLLKSGTYTAEQITDAFCQFNKPSSVLTRRKLEAELFISGMDIYSLYSDVLDRAWYFTGIKWAKEHNIMSGTSATTFEPGAYLTRAMAVKTIANMSGANTSWYLSYYSDVPNTTWYSNAVGWADRFDIVSGVGNGKFAPTQSVTRQDFMVMLYNYGRAFCGVKDWSGLTIVGFSDSSSVSNYAVTAVAWCTRKGIVSGTSDGELSPKNAITRAEAATMLMNFYNYIEG